MPLRKQLNKSNGEQIPHRDGEGLSLIPPTRCESHPVDKKGQQKESYLNGSTLQARQSDVSEMNGWVWGRRKKSAQGTG